MPEEPDYNVSVLERPGKTPISENNKRNMVLYSRAVPREVSGRDLRGAGE
jgi:hypothetical protein